MAIQDEGLFLDAALKGDRDAFGVLVEEYQPLICAITFSGTGQVHISEKLAKEAFLQAWRELSQFKKNVNFKSWLCRIARDIVHNYRREQRGVMGRRRHLDEAQADTTPSRLSCEPVEQLIRKEETMLVQDVILHIPEKYRDVLVLHYREQNTIQELAEKLDICESTVSLRLLRGRKMVRQELPAVAEKAISSKKVKAAVMASIAELEVA